MSFAGACATPRAFLFAGPSRVIVAALNATMPQGFLSSDADSWPTHPHSSTSSANSTDASIVLSAPLVAQWMANSATAPSQDLQNFIAARLESDFKLDPAAPPVSEPRKRTRRAAAAASAAKCSAAS